MAPLCSDTIKEWLIAILIVLVVGLGFISMVKWIWIGVSGFVGYVFPS